MLDPKYLRTELETTAARLKQRGYELESVASVYSRVTSTT